MATWKEKGIVPDSDDEDDLESQSLTSLQDDNEERNNAVYGHTNEDEEDIGLPEHERFRKKQNASSIEDISQDAEAARQPGVFPDSQQPELSEQFTGSLNAHLPSSPIPPKVFKVPDLFWEENEDEYQNGESSALAKSTEEISKSYVRITSPSSSMLSSPPNSQMLPPLGIPGIQNASRLSKERSSELSATKGASSQNTIQEDSVYSMRRALRQRNPIQLHPYIVEQEKYRQTLKARGIAPTRIALSQDRRRGARDITSQDPDTQEHDSQETIIDQPENQAMDFDWGPPTSSPMAPNLSQDDDKAPKEISEVADADDEFPDIEDLVRKQRSFPKAKLKRVKKSYSKKLNRHNLSYVQTRPISNPQNATIQSLHTPASPPLTSSPILPPRPISATLSRIISSASSIPNSATEDNQDRRQIADLLTPATSATKPNPDLIFLDSGSDSDDPFASDRRSSSLESSSDESVQLRRVGKRIRGVLPASHLRLDIQKKKLKAPIRTQRDILSASPVKGVARKGIAIPRSHTRGTPNPSVHGLPFLSDDSEEGTGENAPGGFVMEEDDSPQLSKLFDESRLGFAEEDDNIDAMLPSRKRQLSNIPHPYKRRKANEVGKDQRQLRITEHLKRSRDTISISEGPSKRRKHIGSSHSRRTKTMRTASRSSPPRLSILDIVGYDRQDRNEVPQFIKIAARTARSLKGKGRQSPTRKFIRLATREDTQDAQSVLEDWRSGRILPTITESPPHPREDLRTPLGPVDSNWQIKLTSPSRKMKSQPFPENVGKLGISKLIISTRGIQQSMRDFVMQRPVIQLSKSIPQVWLSRNAKKTQSRSQNGLISARPAQLESSRIAFSRRNPSAAFKSTKTALDALYCHSRKHAVRKPNLQLSRFLADEDVVRSSIETGKDFKEVDIELNMDNQPTQKLLRPRKRSPKRIDASAAIYRQPSHPLVLDFLVQEQNPEGANSSKLLGLGKLGTKYPIHFDILPLQRGIFFHENTLLGSGRLRSIINGDKDAPILIDSLESLKLSDMEFSWASWDETASSEVGVCFDWLLEQILVKDVLDPCQQSLSAVEVVKFIINYAQYHLRFDGLLIRKDFLSRMISIMREFSSRLHTKDASSVQIKPAIEVLSVSTIFVYLLLKMSREDSDSASLAYELEDLLKSVASSCIHFLLIEGVESIRKLYDDLQYLSFRDNGIKDDQFAVQAWVSLIQILNAASIPKGSFWDVTNLNLDLVIINSLNDAPAMENMWYTLYTLLPLCEFDQFGVVVSGLRQTIGFDNWALPQQMLKRLSSLYKTNQRQAPGFNDYCRSIFTRCHYLMVEWGWWKCGGIVGTMFDFFASQNLSHLRNEEVYHSPQFLENLDTKPSLAVEPEDRCFHIFLKVAALGIKHLCGLNDTKNIRNLIARVLPNHDRQYPKEEAVHQRDLASLRNHHDLLCTLYWTAPPDQRPPMSLIQELVVPDRSHKEACLINLRAWENLSRFVVTDFADFDTYRSLNVWQQSFFNAIYQQYTGAEAEVRQQAEVLQRQAGEVMSETRILDTILANKRSINVSMCRSVNAMGKIIKSAKSDIIVKQILNYEVLSKALDPAIHNDKRISDSLLREVVIVLRHYMDQIDRLCPITVGKMQSHDMNEDSQDSLDLAEANWGRLELMIPLGNIVESLSTVIRGRLEASSDDNDQSMSSLVMECWARLISMLTEDEPKKLQSFLTNGKNAVFENRNRFTVASESWPLFLAKLLEHKPLKDFPAGFNIGLEWLLLMTNCQPISTPERMLTFQLHKQGHYLCIAPELDKFDRINIFRIVIQRMSMLLLEKSTEDAVGLSQRITQRLFSDMLGEVMKVIQQNLEKLEPNSVKHMKYLKFARAIITDLKCYASDFRPLIEFFVHPSSSYWPHDADPNLYAAGIVAYSIRLSQQPERTSFELFYYLHGGWKNALIAGRMQNYFSHIKKGMKRWDFAKFMISEFVPSILDAGFSTGGWLLCQTFLPALSQRIGSLLDKKDSHTSWVFENVINLLKMIMNGTKALSQRFQHNVAGIYPEHRGILVVVFRFWFSIAPYMRQYVERYPSETSALEEVTNPLSRLIYNSVQAFHSGDLDGVSFLSGEFDTMKGKFTDKFTAAIIQDIQDYWQFGGDDGFGAVVSNRSKETSTTQVLKESLREVFEGELVGYEALFENREGLQLPERRCKLVMDVFC